MVTYDPKTNSVSGYNLQIHKVDPEVLFKQFLTPVVNPVSAAPSLPVGGGGKAVGPKGPDYSAVNALYSQLNTQSDTQDANALQAGQDPVKVLRGRKVADLSPDLQKLYHQVTASEAKAGIPSKDNSNGALGGLKGGLFRVLDVLSRPNYAIANAYEGAVNRAKADGKFSLTDQLTMIPGVVAFQPLFKGDQSYAEGLKDFWHGLEGKDKTSFINVMDAAHPSMNKWAKFGIGLGLDVATDPTTYMGVGLVKKVATVGGSVKKAKELDDAARAFSADLHAMGVRPVLQNVDTGLMETVHDAPAELLHQQLFGKLPVGAVVDSTQGVKTAQAELSRAGMRALQELGNKRLVDLLHSSILDRKLTTLEQSGKLIPIVKDPVTETRVVTAHIDDFREYSQVAHEYASTNSKIAVLQRKIAADAAQGKPVESLTSDLAKLQSRADELKKIREDKFKIKDTVLDPGFLEEVRNSDAYKHADEAYKAALKSGDKKAIADALEQKHQTFAEISDALNRKKAPGWKKGSNKRRLKQMSAVRLIDEAHGLVEQIKNAPVGDAKEAGDLRKLLRDVTNEIGYKATENPNLVNHMTRAADKIGSPELQQLVRDGIAGAKPRPRYTPVQVLKETVTTPAMSDAELKAATKHNFKLYESARRASMSEAKQRTQLMMDQGMDLIARSQQIGIGRELSFRLMVPFTKTSNSRTAYQLFAIHSPAILSSALDKLAKFPVVEKATKAFDSVFKASAGVDPVINRLHLGAGAANQRIEVHANRLRNMMRPYKPQARVVALQAWKRGDTSGVDGELVAAIDKELNDVLGGLAGAQSMPGLRDAGPITPKGLNAWLPDHLKLNVERPDDPMIGTSDWIKNALKHLPEDTDPAELLWHLNIGKEKVLAKQSIKAQAQDLFGTDTRDLDPNLRKVLISKGYKTPKGLSEHFIFPPDTADDISKMLDVMEPTKLTTLGRGYDKFLSWWKHSVTMLSPGYHARNSFGDHFVNHLAGVTGVEGERSYKQSLQVMKAMGQLMADDSVAKQAVMSTDPYAFWVKTGKAFNPKEALFKVHGTNVSMEDVWVLYSNEGLKSGFISTEFGTNFPKPNSLRGSAVGQKVGGAYRKVLNFSEKREDFFRLANFIHQLKLSPHRNIEEAAHWAADQVRKYNFDYNDFTRSERLGFARVLPFYKWTRKAIPLMIETLFAQPGKALVYPKAMRDMSQAQGYSLQDSKSLIPGADQILPEWVMSRGMFPLGSGKNGNTIYGDIAQPFMDVGRTLGDPVGSVMSMTTPAIQAPFEIATGKSFTPKPYDINPGSLDYASQQNPITNFIAKLAHSKQQGQPFEGVTDPRLLQFLSGVTLHENTDKQMNNALVGRQQDAKDANKRKAKQNKGGPAKPKYTGLGGNSGGASGGGYTR